MSTDNVIPFPQTRRPRAAAEIDAVSASDREPGEEEREIILAAILRGLRVLGPEYKLSWHGEI